MTDLLDAIRRHRALALKMARSWVCKLPKHVLREDLEQAALIGLFDWKRSHPDESVEGWMGGLRIRVRGSILDELRRQDWLPRKARMANPGMRVIGCDDVDPTWEQSWASPAEGADVALERKQQAAEAMRAPMRGRDATLMNLYYWLGKNLGEIADGMNVSEARVCQLHARAIEVMRAQLDGDESVLRPARESLERARRAGKEDHAERIETRRVPERPVPRQSGFYPVTRGALALKPEEEPVTATLPEEGVDLRAELERYQDWMVEQALIRTGGCKAKAARLLGIERTCLVEMLKNRSPLRPGPKQPAEDEPKTNPGVARIPRTEIARLKSEGKTARQAAVELGCSRWLVEREYTRLAPIAKARPRNA